MAQDGSNIGTIRVIFFRARKVCRDEPYVDDGHLEALDEAPERFTKGREIKANTKSVCPAYFCHEAHKTGSLLLSLSLRPVRRRVYTSLSSVNMVGNWSSGSYTVLEVRLLACATIYAYAAQLPSKTLVSSSATLRHHLITNSEQIVHRLCWTIAWLRLRT